MSQSAPWGKLDRQTGARHHLAHHCADVAAAFLACADLPVLRVRLECAVGRRLSRSKSSDLLSSSSCTTSVSCFRASRPKVVQPATREAAWTAPYTRLSTLWTRRWRPRPSCPLGRRVTKYVTRPDVSTKARERNGGCTAWCDYVTFLYLRLPLLRPRQFEHALRAAATEGRLPPNVATFSTTSVRMSEPGCDVGSGAVGFRDRLRSDAAFGSDT